MFRKVVNLVGSRWKYWHPHVADRPRTASLLAHFYANRYDYHAMTAKPEKLQHPQVQLLLQYITKKDLCVEFGCGGGVVLQGVAEKAGTVIGMDVAAIGLCKAKARLTDLPNSTVLQSDAALAPLRDGIADVAYSLEVLEHVWDPESVIKEMIRVLKPGGLLFFTTPNGFSLDLHLGIRRAIRLLNTAGALTVYLRNVRANHIYRNMEPDLTTTPSYSDCDMITKIFPRSLERWIGCHQCSIERLETYFFQNCKAASQHQRKRFEDLERHPFCRYFGDHILLVARKQDGPAKR